MSETTNASSEMPPLPAPFAVIVAQLDAVRVQCDAIETMVRAVAFSTIASHMRAAASAGAPAVATPVVGGRRMPPTFGAEPAAVEAPAPGITADSLTDRLSTSSPTQ